MKFLPNTGLIIPFAFFTYSKMAPSISQLPTDSFEFGNSDVGVKAGSDIGEGTNGHPNGYGSNGYLNGYGSNGHPNASNGHLNGYGICIPSSRVSLIV